MEEVRTPASFFCTGKNTLTSTSPFHLDLLTPPPSGDRDKTLERNLFTSTLDTPLSHHKSTDASLPRAFTRKCNISTSSAKAARNLSSIEEEGVEDTSKLSVVISKLPYVPCLEVSAVITPESLPSKKRVHYTLEDSKFSDTPSVNAIRENLPRDVSRPRTEHGTPRKRVKTLHFHNQALLNAEQKENSPIKVVIGNDVASGRFTYKSREFQTLILRPPPIPLVLRAFEKQQENKCFDIMAALDDRNMHHVIKKILNHMAPIELINMEKVSNRWSQIARDVVSGKLGKAKKLALTSKENLMLRIPPPAKSEFKHTNETTPRKIVKVRNCIESPKRRVPASPDLTPKSKRFHAFLEQGKRLSPSKKLEKCPICRFPAQASDESCATCSACKVTFCIQCRCEPHPLVPCKFVLALSSSPSPLKTCKRPCVASKASRKALRRLLN